jgi:hypothetical protein
MADRKNAGITGSSGKNVDRLYKESFPPINIKDLMNGPKRGAGSLDYIKKMIASGKSKPIKAKK